ncbi:hypothetical protein FHS27_006366, partial [Rhodopirellula rubra]|nr:hypothetical protein [Aporhodopirellula rubra]
ALAILNEIANLQIDILCADTKPVVNDCAIRGWHRTKSSRKKLGWEQASTL